MSLFDEVLKGVLGSQASEAPKQSASLLQGVLEMLDDDDPQRGGAGGIEGLARLFEGGGLGDVLRSWIAAGGNRAISPDDLLRVLGGARVGQLSQRAGLSTGQGASALAALLPVLIDKLTPDGQVPPRAELFGRGRALLEGMATASAGGGPSGGGSRPPKPKADFSDVKSGSSSTAPKPAPPERTYTVVSGDSLSKIAKRVYGDANQWRRIFEANRDQIKDPDLIHPGQKLRIPEA